MKFVRSFLAAVLLFSASAISGTAKTGAVLLVNGNTITGEIRSLDFGALRYSGDSGPTAGLPGGLAAGGGTTNPASSPDTP